MLIVPFVLQIVGAVALVGYLSYRNGQQAVQDLAANLITEKANVVNQHLDGYLAIPRTPNPSRQKSPFGAIL